MPLFIPRYVSVRGVWNNISTLSLTWKFTWGNNYVPTWLAKNWRSACFSLWGSPPRRRPFRKVTSHSKKAARWKMMRINTKTAKPWGRPLKGEWSSVRNSSIFLKIFDIWEFLSLFSKKNYQRIFAWVALPRAPFNRIMSDEAADQMVNTNVADIH